MLPSQATIPRDKYVLYGPAGDEVAKMSDMWIAPFSPLILKTKLPPELLALLVEGTDELLSNEALCDQYAEQSPVLYDVSKRVELPESVMDGRLHAFAHIQQVCTRYIHGVFESLGGKDFVGGLEPTDAQALIEVAWINVQRAGDFVPIHKHSSDLSGALYLKVPENMTGATGMGGQITFVDGRSQQLVRDKISFTPEAGDIFVFPGWLSHTVHPFRGEGERRMMSFNGIIAFPADQ